MSDKPLLTLNEAVKLLQNYPLESYLARFFHGGAREFCVLDISDPLEAIELAYLAEADYEEPRQLHIEAIESSGEHDTSNRALVKVWQRVEYLKSQERKEVVRAEMATNAKEYEIKQAKEQSVRDKFIKLYGITNGPKMFVSMMNGEMDIPGEEPEKERWGL